MNKEQTVSRYLACILIGIATLNLQAAVCKLKNGRVGKVKILDTAAVYDSTVCSIELKGKEGIARVDKKKIEYVAFDADTIWYTDFRCVDVGLWVEQRLLTDKVCQNSYFQGQADAKLMYSPGGWVAGGFASGFMLGLIGTGLAAGAAAGSSPLPRSVPTDVDVKCYSQGFGKQAKKKAIGGAAGGGAAGTLIAMVVVLALLSGQ